MQIGQSSLLVFLYRYKIHHILFWVAYFVFWIAVYISYYPSLWDLIIVTAVYAVFNAAAFYVTAYFLFPRFLHKQKIGLFLLWLGVLLLVLCLLMGYILHLLFRKVTADNFDASFLRMFQFAFVSISTMTGLMLGTKLVMDRIRTDRATRLRDKQRLDSELQYLKAQVNPHFLFNAINSIYFLIKKDPDQAADTLIRLSDLLRFQLYDCSGEKIDIEKEMEYIRNFIALEKIRKGEKVKVSYEQQEDIEGFQIAPFLLIPFVENAFKHVSTFSNGRNNILIRFQSESGRFIAKIENSTDRVIKREVGGIGLKNVIRRLELLYPGKHDLQITEEPEKYSIHLSLMIL
jgi:two-component system, LytTR family, sensor kinase